MIRSLVVLLVAGVLGGVAASGASAATFTAGPCPRLDVAALKIARCGTLTVPENRTTSNGKTIQLPVAILPAVSKTPRPDPIVYMEGGPGGPGIPSAQVMVDAKLNADRDVIVMGERGTAYATPSLVCPEVDAFNVASAGMVYDAPSTGRKMVAAMRACHDRLAKDGVDFGAYNTTENATDFNDLRVALGIASWNVYGVSYGTDLALTYERMFPEGLRSVTVDSVVPPQLTRYGLFWSMAGGGIDTILDACAKRASCAKAYSNPKAQLTQLVRRYEKRPLVGKVKPVLFPGDKPEPGAKATRTVIDGGAFINWVAGFSNVLAPDLPKLLDQLVHGDKTAQRDALRSWNASKHAHEGVYSFGLQNGVVCSEWAPYSTVANTIGDGRAQFPGFPRSVLAQAPQFPWMAEICAAWPVAPAPAVQHTATTGTIPTLIINGSYDAITASQVAAQVAPPLANATFVNVPGVGHFVVPQSPCAYDVMTSFLDALKPDTDCIAGMQLPRFTVE